MPPLYYEDGHDTVKVERQERDALSLACLDYYIIGHLVARGIKPAKTTVKDLLEAANSFQSVEVIGYLEKIEELRK
jgi:hypothetical protein